jgi:chromosomal replication initiator protein
VNAKQIWQTTIERLQTKVQPAVFTIWFQGTSGVSFQDGVFVVCVPTTFVKAYLEGRFTDTIRSMLTEITGSPVEVQFIVAKQNLSEQSGEGTNVLPPASRRPFRLPKNRPVSLQPEKQRLTIDFGQPDEQNQDQTPIAMNSLAPIVSRPSVHRSSNESEPAPTDEAEEFSQLPEGNNRELKSLPTQLFSPPAHESLLNPRYTFDTFIVGKSNQLAHAASLAVADNPGHIYNPMFFYGGVGLGKTHLLHAIGHVGEAKGLNVLYVTSEKFTNEIINAIRFQKTEEFRAKYRQIDILLVDDIQFIAGKESTEEEFFHTFNTLHDANKQIVVTSDRPPKAIHSLQDRLRSRFEWGLLADIQPPVYEHRLAILRSKADSLHFAIPSSVIEYIARPECSSVRELEGWLNRVIAYATLHDAPLSVSLAAKALENLHHDSQKTPTLSTAEVIEGVCRYYNIDIERLKGKQRDRDIVWPRQVAMYIMREATHASLLQIGAELGGRDHTTILHGCEKVQSEIDNNDRMRREIATLRETLQQR